MASLTISPNPAPELRPSGSDASALGPGEAGGFRDLVGEQLAPQEAREDTAGSPDPKAEHRSPDETSSEESADYGAAVGQASFAEPAAAPPVAAHPSRAASTTQGQYIVPLPISVPSPTGDTPPPTADGPPGRSSTEAFPAFVSGQPAPPAPAVVASDAPTPPPVAPASGVPSSVSAPSSSASEPASVEASFAPRPETQPVLPAASGRPEPTAAPSPAAVVLPPAWQNASGETVTDFLGYQAVLEVNRSPLAGTVLVPAQTVASGESSSGAPRLRGVRFAPAVMAASAEAPPFSGVSRESSATPVRPVSAAPATDTLDLSLTQPAPVLDQADLPHPADSADFPTLDADPPAPPSLASVTRQGGGLGTAAPARPESAASAAPAVKPEAMAMIQQVREAVHAARNAPAHELVVRLDPPELGTVRVVVQRHEGVLTATLQVTQPEAREMLQRHRADLQTALTDSGLRVGDCTVELQNQTTSQQQEQQTLWSRPTTSVLRGRPDSLSPAPAAVAAAPSRVRHQGLNYLA